MLLYLDCQEVQVTKSATVLLIVITVVFLKSESVIFTSIFSILRVLSNWLILIYGFGFYLLV